MLPLRSLALTLAFALGAVLPARADAPTAPVLDPAIASALTRISPAELRATDQRLVAFGTRSTFSENSAPGRGIFAADAYLLQRFRQIARSSGGRLTVAYDGYLQRADPSKRIPRDVEIRSVVATLKGDDPSGRTYVLSSHIDSRNSNNDDGVHDAPGADDNGSGTSAVVEAARVLAGTPLHATLIFACFDSEEQGLFGSAHLAKVLKDAGADVAGDVNNDIIGASVGDDGVKRDGIVRIFSEALPPNTSAARINAIGGENDSPSRELARFAKETGDAYDTGLQGTMIYRADRFLRGGDHESFNDQGFAAIRFVEPVENFNHQHQDVRVENGVQYGDLLQYMDFDYLAKVTRYNVATIASLAMAPAAPKVSVDTKALTNDTLLSWPRVPRAVRYEVLRRSTTDPFWTDVEAIVADPGDAGGAAPLSATLHYSKDNWLFGVRSVDAQGHRSVVGYPTPVR